MGFSTEHSYTQGSSIEENPFIKIRAIRQEAEIPLLKPYRNLAIKHTRCGGHMDPTETLPQRTASLQIPICMCVCMYAYTHWGGGGGGGGGSDYWGEGACYCGRGSTSGAQS